MNYLSKDYGCNKRSTNKVIEKAVKEKHNDCTRNATEGHTTERRRYNRGYF